MWENWNFALLVRSITVILILYICSDDHLFIIIFVVFIFYVSFFYNFIYNFFPPDLYEICRSRAEDRIRLIQESKDAPGSPESKFCVCAELCYLTWVCRCTLFVEGWVEMCADILPDGQTGPHVCKKCLLLFWLEGPPWLLRHLHLCKNRQQYR